MLTEFPDALPSPLTPLIGREQVLAALMTRFRLPNVRLLMVTGPGGVGKTHLTLHFVQSVFLEFPMVFFMFLWLLSRTPIWYCLPLAKYSASIQWEIYPLLSAYNDLTPDYGAGQGTR
jgi:hypothetical protein